MQNDGRGPGFLLDIELSTDLSYSFQLTRDQNRQLSLIYGFVSKSLMHHRVRNYTDLSKSSLRRLLLCSCSSIIQATLWHNDGSALAIS